MYAYSVFIYMKFQNLVILSIHELDTSQYWCTRVFVCMLIWKGERIKRPYASTCLYSLQLCYYWKITWVKYLYLLTVVAAINGVGCLLIAGVNWSWSRSGTKPLFSFVQVSSSATSPSESTIGLKSDSPEYFDRATTKEGSADSKQGVPGKPLLSLTLHRPTWVLLKLIKSCQ